VRFFTVLWRIVVGLVARPWRLLWVVLVAMGTSWLTTQTSQDGATGMIIRMLIPTLGVVLSAPALTSALNHTRRRHDQDSNGR
jgi:hypothetical protein